jgi:hypothetical protein
MKGKRNRFARLGILSIVLLLSLGIMGVGYAGWTATALVDGTAETGSWVGVLDEPVAISQNITLDVEPPDILDVSVSNALANTTYTGSFEVNNVGTVPIRIGSIDFDLPPNVTASVSGVSAGDQIEPGETKSAIVSTSTPIAGKSYDFTVTFTFVLWNESICLG